MNHLKINQFKCFVDADININQLTVIAPIILKVKQMAALVVPVLNDYLHLIKENKLRLRRLAINITGDLHVWAEIKEGDEITHNKLLLIESEINSKYFESTQIFLDSMIVDEADNIAMPSVYQEVSL